MISSSKTTTTRYHQSQWGAWNYAVCAFAVLAFTINSTMAAPAQADILSHQNNQHDKRNFENVIQPNKRAFKPENIARRSAYLSARAVAPNKHGILKPTRAPSTTSSTRSTTTTSSTKAASTSSTRSTTTTSSTMTTTTSSTTTTTSSSTTQLTTTGTPVPTPIPLPSLQGKAQVGYFANWNIYEPVNYFVTSIPANKFSHLFYAFASVDSNTGQVRLSDPWADIQYHYPGDSWSDTGNNVYGNIKQLGILKAANRHLKVLLSIGGWVYSNNIASMISNPSARSMFISSALQLVNDLGFDGVDIDWETMTTAQQAADFLTLVKDLRTAFTIYANSKNETNPYMITIACQAGWWDYTLMKIAEMNPYIDLWNLMAYDYAGSWSSKTGYLSDVYGDSTTPFSSDTAIKYYESQGVASNKITIGIPLYGRSFENTAGMNQPFSGVGPGQRSAGIWQYNVLPRPNATVYYNSKLIASYSYDSVSKELIAFDTPQSVAGKAQYINSNNLGGTMFWELAGDYPISSPNSLIATAYNGLTGGLDQRLNHVSFPTSQYANLVAGFGASSASKPKM